MRVAEGAYNSNWIDGNRQYRNFIQIIMTRAQKEQILTGLNFLDANLETFKWVRNLKSYESYEVFIAVIYRLQISHIHTTQCLSLCITQNK